jgi:hypothetical protein
MICKGRDFVTDVHLRVKFAWATVRFGNSGAAPTDGRHVKDINNDGLADLVFQFPTPATGILCGYTSETLTGKTVGGTPSQGTDSVITVSCKK